MSARGKSAPPSPSRPGGGQAPTGFSAGRSSRGRAARIAARFPPPDFAGRGRPPPRAPPRSGLRADPRSPDFLHRLPSRPLSAGALGALALAAGLGAVSAGCREEPFWPGPEAAERAFDALYREVRGRVLAGDFARPDGFAYAVDIGELLKLAARRSDREMADALRAFARSRLLLDSPDDPFARGFVVWRRPPEPPAAGDDEPDASGTTEALRVSQGLRETAAAFDAPEDREDALLILDGYARHAAEAEGLLLVRNYFDLGSRAFATNSFLVDYGPDYLARVGRAERREDLADLARRSYEVVRAAESPAGLLYDVFQPEMATLFDDRRTLLFSPNDIVQTSNAASVALQAVEGAPEVADRVLAFCRERMPGLRLAYYGRTGEPARQKRPGVEIWGTLTELAARRGDRASIGAFAPFLVTNAAIERVPEDAFLYVAAHLLLGLEALRDFFDGDGVTAAVRGGGRRLLPDNLPSRREPAPAT